MKAENKKALKKAIAQLRKISETFRRVSVEEKYWDLQYRAVQIEEMLSADNDECGLEPMLRYIETTP